MVIEEVAFANDENEAFNITKRRVLGVNPRLKINDDLGVLVNPNPHSKEECIANGTDKLFYWSYMDYVETIFELKHNNPVVKTMILTNHNKVIQDAFK